MSQLRRFRAWIAHKGSLLTHRLGYYRLDAEEYGIVLQFRTYRAHEQKLAGAGCGGCPSQGGCSEAEADVGDPSL